MPSIMATLVTSVMIHDYPESSAVFLNWGASGGIDRRTAKMSFGVRVAKICTLANMKYLFDLPNSNEPRK